MKGDDRKSGVAAEHKGELGAEVEDVLPVDGWSEEVADFKKEIQQLNYVSSPSPNSFREVGEVRLQSSGTVTFSNRIRRILIYEWPGKSQLFSLQRV